MGTNPVILDTLDEATKAALLAAVQDMQASGEDVIEDDVEPAYTDAVLAALRDADDVAVTTHDVEDLLGDHPDDAEPEPTPEPEPAVEPEPAPTLVTGKLTLNKAQRESLVGLFTVTSTQKLRRVKGLLPYTRWTCDEIIVAIHENADKCGDELVIDTSSRSTMKRSLAVARAWVTTKANELVDDEDDTRDAVLGDLAQIADITPGALDAYLVAEADREDRKVKEWDEVVIPARGTTPELAIDVDHGCGEGAMPGIIAEYVTHRAKSPEIAAEWVRLYRVAVQFANNEKRRAGQAHDSAAAGARKGDGDGSSKRGARNQGGTGKDAPTESVTEAERKAAGMPDHRLPGEKPLREASIGDLIVALTKRVVDYSVAISPEDAKAWDEMIRVYDVRFEHVPLGRTAAQQDAALRVVPEETVVELQATHRATLQGPGVPLNRDALVRAIVATLAARGLSPETLEASASRPLALVG